MKNILFRFARRALPFAVAIVRILFSEGRTEVERAAKKLAQSAADRLLERYPATA